MSKRGKLFIIPNENEFGDEIFKIEVTKDHLTGINEFCSLHKLNYQFKDDDYQEAPCLLALQGHLVVKTEEESKIAICYIPKIVTDNQNIWIHNEYFELQNYSIVAAYLIGPENDYKNPRHKNGLDEIIKVCDKRNLFYEKKEVEENVGKKI